MTRGKHTCKILKEIRQQIAEQNNIDYVTSECHFQGECKGTCPKCEAEVRFLENELYKRRQLGKAVALAGISLGIVSSFSACNSPKSENSPFTEIATEITKDTMSKVKLDTTNLLSSDTNLHIPNLDSIIHVIDGEVIGSDWTLGFVGELEDEVSTFVPVPIPITDQVEIPDEFPPIDYINTIEGALPIMSYPEYPGGQEALYEFIKKNIKYPKEAKKKKIEGVVLLEFTVDETGKSSNIRITHDIGYGCGEEAVRILKMIEWMSGYKEKSVLFIPFKFSLKD